jgi:hypothetical protein
MKKLALFLSTLLLVGCGSQSISPQLQNEGSVENIFTNQTSPLNAKKAYPIALKEVKKLLPAPQLFEIDVWKETNSDTIDFGFMQKNSDGSYKYIRIIIDRLTSKVSHEIINDNGKIPTPVDLKYWKIDNSEILKIAQTNGLTDQTYLETLWEDTWHISGLKQDLYFQIDSQNGKIKMICTDPYLTNCTDSTNNPITLKSPLDIQKKRKLLK